MAVEFNLPNPVGLSVAEVLDISHGGRVTSSLHHALSVIERVHGDGVLPRVPVVENATMRKEAEYTRNSAGQAVQIAVNPRAAQIGLSFLHEIGHFLEHKGIGLANFEMLAAFHRTAAKSQAVRELKRLARRQSTLVSLPNGLRMRYNMDNKYLRYLLTEEEIWARAYAQYIVVRSQDEVLLSELEARRKRRAGQLYYPRQWDEGDFQPLAREIEDLFLRLEWQQ